MSGGKEEVNEREKAESDSETQEGKRIMSA